MIRKEDIARILDAVRIEEVVGDFVTLKKKGANMFGLCPFHNEKTPSFTVAPVKGIYKCFGCGKAGNAVNFMMEHEHYTYPEALRYLARKYGVDIVEEEADEEYELKRSEEEQAFFVHEFAQKWFISQLWESKQGQTVALSYFRERGFSDATIHKFQLGYSPEEYDAFFKHAQKQGFKEDVLIKNGLVTEERKNDRFRARVIFPIHSASGRVLAFGGRTMRSDKNIAKYLNSPETPIYRKSEVLYGIYFAKNAIHKENVCYLTEGYTDVISLHQAGVENVVSSSGTSLTIGQIKSIRRFTPNITILFDGDSAGIKASFRAIDMILSEGMNVRVVLFPEGEDPDSFARNHSSAELLQYLKEESSSFIIFKAENLLKDAESDPVERATAIRDIVASIAAVPDPITRSEFIKDCSRRFDITEKDLVFEMNKVLRSKATQKIRQEDGFEVDIPQEKKETPSLLRNTNELLDDAEKKLIQLILNYGNTDIKYFEKNEDARLIEKSIKTADFIFNQLEEEELEFRDASNIHLLELCKKQFNEDGKIDTALLFHILSPDLVSYVADLMDEQYVLSPNWEIMHRVYVQHKDNNAHIFMAVVDGSVLEFKRLIVRHHIDEINKKFEQKPNNEEMSNLLLEFYKWKNLEVKINKDQLNRVIIK
ncbi:MAG: DNA primase [Bacteroidales bacterium]|nr:DNA primase [Bacteroidales bacterium]